MQTLKVCVFGEYGVGKSTFINWYIQNRIVEQYDPGIEDYFRKQLMVYGKQYTLEILDYADGTLNINSFKFVAHEQFTAMRDLAMKNSEAFLLVFSITKRSSFEYVKKCCAQIFDIKSKPQNLMTIIEASLGTVPIILVATKCDLMKEREVSSNEVIEFVQKMSLSGYIEVCTMKHVGVYHAFESLARFMSGIGRNFTNGIKKGAPVFTSNIKLGKYEETEKEFPSIDLIPSDVWEDLEKVHICLLILKWKIYIDGTFSDVLFLVEGKTINAHKIVLGLRSHYFKHLFQMKETIEVVIEDSTFEIFQELLRFCYKPILALSENEKLTKLKEVNSKYKVLELNEYIDDKLKTSSNINSLQTSVAIQTEMAPGLRDFSHLADVTFVVDNDEFHLHKCILTARSKWFAAMLQHDFKESKGNKISITSMTSNIFNKVIEYIYTGRIENLSPDDCIEALVAGNMLGLKRLTQLCEKNLFPLLDAENVISICLAAEHHLAQELVEACIHVIVREFETVKSDPDFKNLSDSTKKIITERRNQFEIESQNKKIFSEHVKKNIILYDDVVRLGLK